MNGGAGEGRWRRREPPLAAGAVAACGAAACRLAAEAARRVEEGVVLRAAADDEWVVVLGMAEDLPWVDGARYLGWDGGVLVPTTHEPVPSTALWSAAVREAVSGPDASTRSLLVLLPGHVLHTQMPEQGADAELLRTRADARTGVRADVRALGGAGDGTGARPRVPAESAE
ncbi:hypothetical protein OG216_06090 [Streptomycetaceae bacterium NBC_01309]